MSDYFTYDWEFKGEPARFTVDMAYQEGPFEFNSLITVFLRPFNVSFTASEIKYANKLLSKIQKSLYIYHYVGRIDTNNIIQYYFYVPNGEDTLAPIENISVKDKRLSISATLSLDTGWSAYKSLLLPDAAKYQTRLNEDYIIHMKDKGDACEITRRIAFVVCFASEDDLFAFREPARQAGFALGEKMFQAEYSFPHLLTLYMLSSLDKKAIDSITTKIIRIITPYNGQLLRWSCPKMNKKNPLQ